MLRILLLIPNLTGVGGTERMVCGLSHLLSEGYEVFESSFDSRGAKPYFVSGAPFFPLGTVPRLPLVLRWFSYAIQVWRLARLKRRLGIDITISNLWRADLINVLSGGKDRKIALCHINVVGNPTNRLMLRFRRLVAFIYRRFDRVLAVNESLAHELRSLYCLSESKLGFINNFVDPQKVDSVWSVSERKRFVWCGRFSNEKNVEGLLAAFSLVALKRPDAQLVLLGDGPLFEEAQWQAEQFGLKVGKSLRDDGHANSLFLGQVDQPSAYMKGSLALLISSYAEGLPMVLLEAIAVGLPVIAADCPGGGIHTALRGEGNFRPGRVAAETTPLGILLPVPMLTHPETLDIWKSELLRFLDNMPLCLKLSEGAIIRSKDFGREAVSARWYEEIAAVGAK